MGEDEHDLTFQALGRPAAYTWTCWTCDEQSRLYDREQDAKAQARQHSKVQAGTDG